MLTPEISAWLSQCNAQSGFAPVTSAGKHNIVIKLDGELLKKGNLVFTSPSAIRYNTMRALCTEHLALPSPHTNHPPLLAQCCTDLVACLLARGRGEIVKGCDRSTRIVQDIHKR